MYEDKWWLASIIEKQLQKSEVFVKFLHPAGSSRYFYYSNAPDMLHMPLKSSVLAKVNPTTATGSCWVYFG